MFQILLAQVLDQRGRVGFLGGTSVLRQHRQGSFPPSLLLLSLLSIHLQSANATAAYTVSDCVVVAGDNGGSSALNALSGPTGVALDASGQIFVADHGNGRIMKWVEGGTTGVQVAGGSSPGSLANQLLEPIQVRIAGDGTLVISEAAPGRISLWGQGASSGTNWLNGLTPPHGIALDAAGDLLMGFQYGTNVNVAYKVVVGSSTAEAWTGSGSPDIVPIDVDFDRDGNIYLLNYRGNGAGPYPAAKTVGGTTPYCMTLGRGSDLNDMMDPKGFEVDSTRHFWVADTGNNRVIKCDDDPNNRWCELIIEGLAEPYGITLNDAETFFYVTEKSANRVLKCPTGYTSTTTSSSSSSSSTVSSTTSSSSSSTASSTTSSSSSSTVSSTTSSSTSSTVTTSTSTSITTSSSSTSTSSSTRTTTTTTSPTTTTSSTISSTSSSTSTSTQTTSTSTTLTTTTTTTTSYTTTFTTTPPPPFPELPSATEVAANLLSEVAKVTARLLQQLQGGDGQATASIPGGTLTAVALGTPESLANSTGDNVSFEIEGADGPVTVSIPASAFAGLPPSSVPGDNAVLLVSTFSSSESASSLGGQQTNPSPGSEGIFEVQVKYAIMIDLGYLLSGESVPVTGLEEPIVFQMPGINYTDGLDCAYWKENGQFWSTDGVGAPAGGNGAGQPLVCETYHLSFFAAITAVLKAFIQTFQCTQFGLLTPDAIKNLFSDSAWLTSPAAWVCWAIFACAGLAFGLAMYLDFKRERNHRWRAEFFLVATGTGSEPVTVEKDKEEEEETGPGSEEAEPTTKPSSLSRIVTGGVAGTAFCAHCLWQSSAVQEAVNEVFSSWFEYWGNVRGACETLYGVVAEGSGAVPTAVVHRMTVTLLMSSSRRLVASSLGVTNDVVAFVLEDEDLQDFLTEGHRQTNTTGSRAHDWKTAEDQRVAWASLHDTVVHHVLEHTGRHTAVGLPRLILDFFLYHNPVGGLFVHDIFHSCKKRVLLLGVDLMGALTMSCVFFEAAGIVRGKPVGGGGNCGGENPGGWAGIAFRLGRFLAIATGSLIVSALPVSIIASFETKGFRKLDYPGSEAWKKQLRVWETQNTIVWTLSILYMAFCVFFILVFLASIGTADQDDWSTSGAIALAEEFLLMPFFLALFIPTMTSAFLALHGRMHRMDHATVIRKSHESLLRQTNMMLPVMRV